jgi:hypothetical protein
MKVELETGKIYCKSSKIFIIYIVNIRQHHNGKDSAKVKNAMYSIIYDMRQFLWDTSSCHAEVIIN